MYFVVSRHKQKKYKNKTDEYDLKKIILVVIFAAVLFSCCMIFSHVYIYIEKLF